MKTTTYFFFFLVVLNHSIAQEIPLSNSSFDASNRSSNELVLRNIKHYFGPTFYSIYQTEWISDYRNAQYDSLNVREVKYAYATYGTKEQPTRPLSISQYDSDGFITGIEYFTSTIMVETKLGMVEKNKHEKYIYENNRRKLTIISYAQLKNRIDTLYVNTIWFDKKGRKMRYDIRSCYKGSSMEPKSIFYAFDEHDNCVLESGTGFGMREYDFNHLYDINGNIQKFSIGSTDVLTRYYEYDAQNRIIQMIKESDTVSIDYYDNNQVKNIRIRHQSLDEYPQQTEAFDPFYDFSFCEKANYSYAYNEKGQVVARSYCCESGESGYVLGKGPGKTIYTYTSEGLIESERETSEDCLNPILTENRTFFQWVYFYSFE